ncbi:MAG: hypothetical protein DMF78_00075 [Acidobacteria bacterium]|nr:MAG: hypothetical protein DMF78_00075 [Acidobacteriota bacterium]
MSVGRRRAAWAAAALAVLAADARPALAGEVKERTEVLDEVTAAATADTLLNADGRVYRPDRVANRLRVLSQVTVDLPAAITFKSRGAFDARHAEATPGVFEWTLPEAYLRRPFGRAELSVGRKILRWSNGYAFTPAGLLDPVRDPADPQDRLGSFEGRDMVEVDLYLGAHTLSAVYTPGKVLPGAKTAQEELFALRYHVLFHGVDLSVMGAHHPASVDAAAASVSYVVGGGLEVHAESALSRGSALLLPRSAVPGGQQTLFGPDFYAPLRQDDRRLYVRWLAGLNYTVPGGVNVVLEYFHAPDGLGADEWRRFVDQGRFSRALFETGTFPPVSDGRSLPELNLLQALRGLGGGTLGRDYGLVRIGHPRPLPGVEASALALVNLRDRSLAVVPELSVQVQRRTTAYMRGTFMSGGAESEFGNVPVSWSANFGVRVAF